MLAGLRAIAAGKQRHEQQRACFIIYLAGSDDKLVCIYELRAGSGARAFGSNDQPSVENWKHAATLRGHMNNVLDVAWSPEDHWLASCSVDNKVHKRQHRTCTPGPGLHVESVANANGHASRSALRHAQCRLSFGTPLA